VASWTSVARRIRVPLGFVFAGFYLWVARPTPLSILLGSVVIFSGLLVRAAASGHVEENEALSTHGPYAYSRNPLYLGSLVVAAGFALAARSWWVPLVAAAMFFAIYFPVIRAEEAFLKRRFPEFDEYRRNVPRLWPRLRPYVRHSAGFSWHLYLKNREYNATAGALLMVLALAAKALSGER
jgi:protein-S-isoprenylcysteine O-methyltransferase Ste14